MARALLGVICAFAIVVSLAGAADFTDPRGDAGTAPDITAVSAIPSAQSVAFRITVANMDRLAAGSELFLAIDRDRGAVTGDQHGVDFVYSLREGGSVLRTRRWSGTQHVSFASTATGSYESGVATFVVTLEELGFPSTIGFGAIGSRAPDSDAAPGNGSWPLVLREALRVRSAAVRFAPSAPVAGRAFRVAAASGLLSDGTSRAATASCTARIAGRRLAGSRCSWRLPSSARGKPLTISVRVRVDGVGTVARAYRFRIT
jgi:hypothetical protein